MRYFYAVKMFYKHKKTLCEYIASSELCITRAVDLDLLLLKKNGIKILILDFDGVLAAHAERKPYPEVVKWLQKCVIVFGMSNIFILSNNPNKDRIKYFTEYFPELEFISVLKKKPYPDGILYILNKSKLQSEQLLLLDDRLATGILAAKIANIKSILIYKPYINIKKHLFKESFFMLLRWLEKKIIKIIN